MDKSLRPRLSTSNPVQPSQTRSLWDICKEWISLAWSWSAFLHPCSGSSYGTQKLHKTEENARHDGMVLIFLRTLLWKFMLGCYQMVSRHQSTREATMAHMPCPWSCLVTWFSWKWPLVPLSARPITARRGMASTAYSCSQELKYAVAHVFMKGITRIQPRIVRARFMIEISWKESSMFGNGSDIIFFRSDER